MQLDHLLQKLVLMQEKKKKILKKNKQINGDIFVYLNNIINNLCMQYSYIYIYLIDVFLKLKSFVNNLSAFLFVLGRVLNIRCFMKAPQILTGGRKISAYLPLNELKASRGAAGTRNKPSESLLLQLLNYQVYSFARNDPIPVAFFNGLVGTHSIVALDNRIHNKRKTFYIT